MIQEIAIFTMGFCLASIIRIFKIIYITKVFKKEMAKDIADAVSMQAEFQKNGSSKELADRQAESVSKLGKHVGREEMLKYFNYIIW